MFPLLTLFLSLAVPHQTVDKVTYSTVAVPMKRALAELSDRVGVRLEASPELAREPLILDVHDVELKELEQRIADTCLAEWQKDKDVLRLVRTPRFRKELEAKEFKFDVESAQVLLDSVNAYLAKHPAFGPKEAREHADRVALALTKDPESESNPGQDYRRIQKVSQDGPLYILYRRLLACFTANDLAQLPIEERVVYSFQPTPLQRPFPAGASKVLADFNASWAAWTQAARDKHLERFINRDRGIETNMMYLLQAAEKDPVPVSKVLLSVNRTLYDPVGNVRLMIADQNGKILIETYGSPMEQVYVEQQTKPRPQLPPGAPIQFSALTREWSEAYSKVSLRGPDDLPKPVPVSAELRSRLLDPEHYDPLSFAASEALLATAKAEGKQLAAYLTDDMGSALEDLPNRTKPDTSIVRTRLNTLDGCDIQDSDGWLTVRPRRPLRCLHMREDRKALGAFLRTIDKEGRKTLDSEAAYVASFQSDAVDNFTLGQERELALFPTPWTETANRSRQALWFHGSMSIGQRAQLQQGAVRFDMLEPKQQATVIRILKGERQALVPDTAPFGTFSVNVWAARPYWSIERDATQALLGGVSPSASVAVAGLREPGFRAVLTGSGGPSIPFTGPSAAQTYDAVLRAAAEGRTNYDWIEPRIADTHVYSVRFGDGLRLDIPLSDLKNAGPRITDPSRAPDEFLKLVTETLRQLRPPPRQPPPPPG